MSLSPRRLGSYDVIAQLGEGGMGQVYRARDTKLQRDVALKVLRPEVANDHERLARFRREAQVLAALNHPHIGAIHGLEESGGTIALVMELVEGEDLAARIARGPVPVDEALALARQIADALEAAHEAGIVHRDLKPANIKVRVDGTVKVLDFGLAKAMTPAGSSSEAAMNSPTLSLHATQPGVILGTAAYMAPEQARGHVVDRRADIWAFGCVLYEMLTGRRPFGGDDVSMTLAAVLKEPVDFSALPEGTSTAVTRLLRRCLEKDPRKRLSAIGDARLELDAAETEPAAATPTAPPPPRPWPSRLGWAAIGALVAGAATAVVVSRPPVPVPVVRSQFALPEPIRLANDLAVSIDPSGRDVVYTGRDEAGGTRLYRRRLDQEVSEPIPGTEGAVHPQFSGDGRWLYFTQSDTLKRMPKDGGGVVEVAAMSNPHGVAPLPDGGVVYTPVHGSPLYRVEAPGATPIALTKIDVARGEAGHHWPHLLPGGRHILFTTEIDGKPYSEAKIELLSLDSGERRVLIDGGTDARYVPTGHLVYWRDATLWTVPFDLESLRVNGAASAVAQELAGNAGTGRAAVSIAGNGTVVYVRGRVPEEDRGLMLVDRSGAARELTRERRAYWTASVSPDGRRIAATVLGANDSIWIVETERGQAARATYEAENHSPIWSPDGQRLVLVRYRGGEPGSLFLMPADGSTPPAPLPTTDGREWPGAWNGANGMLAFGRADVSPDIWVMPADGQRKPAQWLATRFAETGARFSPDGRWLAYASNESGRFEIYVRAFPGPGAKYTISSDGGKDPRWRADGREIFFRNGNTILAAGVTTTPGFVASEPRALFSGAYFFNELEDVSWDVMPDGQSFVLIRQFSQAPSVVSIVQGWWSVITAAHAGK